MKHFLLTLSAAACGLLLLIGVQSCGITDEILDLGNVEKADLTNPLFLSYDNTMDSKTKKVWAFNATEAAQATITVVSDKKLCINTKLYFESWSISGKKITLGESKTYDMKKVTVLSYDAIKIGGYICIPSTNKSLDGKYYEDEWFASGLTTQQFWNALRESYSKEGESVDIMLR